MSPHSFLRLGLCVGLVAMAGCSKRREAVKAPPPPQTEPATAIAPVSTPSSDATAPAPSCTARLRNSVHLRPAEQEKSAGPTLAAGTALNVLAQGSLTRKGLPIYRVKVTSSQLIGYVFLTERELGAECPFVFAQPNDSKVNEPEDTGLDNGGEPCFRTGTFKDRKQMFNPECLESHGKPEAPKYKLDVNGDGLIDELLTYGNDVVLALNSANGFTPLLFSRALNNGNHDSNAAWLPPVQAGDAVYLPTSYHETTTFDEIENESFSVYTLHRVRADGKVFAVFHDSVDQADVTREFRGNADGSVVISDGKNRKQTLRWNAKLYRFVP